MCVAEGKNVTVNTSTSICLSFHFAWEIIFRDQTTVAFFMLNGTTQSDNEEHGVWFWMP